jgi:prolyl oligopeptidase
VPHAELADPSACLWQRVAGLTDGVTAFAVHGDDLYLVTQRGGLRSQVVKVPLAAPDLAGAIIVVPDGQRAVREIQPLDSPEIADIIDIARW